MYNIKLTKKIKSRIKLLEVKNMENYEKIKSLSKRAGISGGKLKDEFLFTIQMMDYFYYNENIGEQDIKENFIDGTSDGGIDYIFNSDDVMYLVQGKSTNSLSLEDIRNALIKMDVTVNNFEKGKYDSYSEKLKSTYLNAYDDLSENKNITLVIFTNTIFSEEFRNKVDKLKEEEFLNNYNVEIYDAKDIDSKKLTSSFDKDFIQQDSIKLSEAKNVLKYGENGIIVNIKASSLKKLYVKNSKKGLFSYNLREHISQKNVDTGIENTIKNDKDNFWFYNNGITIGCEEFVLDGYMLKLYNFSIINGAQTTTKIGESKLIIDNEYDFDIVCKVVKAERSLNSESNFIMKISEASNSQKTIKARDLKANAIEQKTLQSKCAENKNSLAIEIKRGVKPKNYSKVEKWQRVTNEYIGQLILACLLQRPGTARSGKIIIFTSEKLYNQIYKNRKQDYDIIYELVKIADKYEEFKSTYTNNIEDVDLIAACKNGKFTVLSIIFYLYKRFNNLVENCMDERLNEDNIVDTKLTLDYKEDDYDKKLNELFKFIIKKLSDIYEKRKESLKLTSYSNFLKTDKIYQEIILTEFDRVLDDEWDKEKLEKIMDIFN